MAEPTGGGYDLLRLAIETRKDQMAAQRWTVRAKKKEEQKAKQKRADELVELLQEPDLEHDFLTWQRMLLEDLFVLDAPTVYFRDFARDRKIPEVVDGATIKRLISEDGRTPLPPDPAYQQIIKGLPAFDYGLDELLYMPRNPRPHRIYGLGPVEQVILTIQTALNRQLSQLLHYTAGNIPAALISVPENWTPNQIRDFQTHFDAYLAGNLEAKSGAVFIPGGSKPTITKDSPVKDEFDEWLARLICFCFSLSPQALTRQMNRATAETSKAAAQEEGLEPLKLYFKSFMNRVLVRAYGAGDFEFAYEDEEIADPETKANVVSILAGKKPVITVDEARGQYGMEPLTEDQKAELAPPPPPQLGGVDDAGNPTKPGEKAPPAKPEPPDAEKIAKALVVELEARRGFIAKTMPARPPPVHVNVAPAAVTVTAPAPVVNVSEALSEATAAAASAAVKKAMSEAPAPVVNVSVPDLAQATAAAVTKAMTARAARKITVTRDDKGRITGGSSVEE